MLIRVLGLLLLSLSGCKVGPQYHPPCTNLPEAWTSMPSEGMEEETPDCFVWWEELNDPILNFLIETASQQNLDLHIAAMRVLEARALKQGGLAAILPHLDGSFAYQHVYYSKDALIKGLLFDPTTPIKRNVDFFEMGFDAEWEIDLFGVTAHEMAALQAQIEASEESLCDMWITLSAEIARTYVELRGLQKRAALLTSSIEMQRDAILITEDLVDLGKLNSFDVLHAQAQLNVLEAQKPLLDVQAERAIHRLSILLGYAPHELIADLGCPEKLPELPFCKPIGVPSELLRRRPDIRKAERELAAATERVGSAVASLFPRFSLVGFVGSIATHLPTLTKPSALAWSAGPSLLLPIFNSSMIMQDINLNKIRTRQALYAYQKTVLSALEETENAIATFHAGMEQKRFLLDSEKAFFEAYENTKDLYERGIMGYLELIAANRALLDAEDAAIQNEVGLLVDYISLYKALGGCFSCCD